MKPIILHHEAELEVLHAVAYYDQQREGLGDEFQEQLEIAVKQIRRMPQVFSPYGEEGLRKCVLPRFPYSIFFLELDDCIWIAAVAHQKRKPGYWAARQPNE